jgi:hypothetical protein
MFPEGEDRSYFLFIKHLGSWADLSQDAIDLDHDLSLAIEVLRTYDAKCSVSGDAVQLDKWFTPATLPKVVPSHRIWIEHCFTSEGRPHVL